MKNLIGILFFWTCFACQASAQAVDIADVRKNFKKGFADESICKQYIEKLKTTANNPVEKGYLSIFHFFMAHHAKNPFKKLSYFKTGRKLLETQIERAPNDIELRFIRLVVQQNAPGFLGYNDDIEQDKAFVLTNLNKINNAQTKATIFNHLKQAKILDADALISTP